MTVLRNNFDGGPAGTAVTAANSGQVPGNNAFQVVTPDTASNVIRYASAAALERSTAEFVLEVSTSTPANSAGLGWTTAMGTQTQVWWRQYIYLTGWPTTPTSSFNLTLFESDNGVAYTGLMDIESDTGKVEIANGPFTSVLTSTTGIALNSWVRLEAWFKYSTTVGAVELRLFHDADSEDPTETISASGWNMGGANSNTFLFGYIFNDTNRPTGYISNLELNNTGWPGPAPFRLGRGSPSGMMTNCVAIHTSGE